MKSKTTFSSGISKTTHLSYFKYLKEGLSNISSRLSLKVYKTASKKEYPIFERNKDVRVNICWDNESKYEFIVENSFFYQNNSNSDDRKYMRVFADVHLSKLYDAVERGKNKK